LSEAASAEDAPALKVEVKAKPQKPDVKKILAADISAFSEDARIAHVAVIRSAVEHLSRVTEPGPAVLNDRIRLLRMWNALVNLRVAHVRSDGEPPETRAEPYKKRARGEQGPAKGSSARSPGARAFVAGASTETGAGLFKLKLVKDGVVRGVNLPAGMLVEVEPNDAKELLDSGKAEHVTI
jgi:hypothetical protein